MLSDADVALARISDIAYLNTPTGLPAGFFPVTQAALGLATGANESYDDGVYQNRNGAALVLVGTLNGKTTAILAFRGSDDREDSINDLQNVNREFQLFPTLIAAFDAFVTRQQIPQVMVTGHSLGGAMDQLFMAGHGNTNTLSYYAETFGSPGAVIYPGTDNRITNIRVTDDPAIYLGENRAAVGADIQSNPALAAAAVFIGPEVFPGLTPADVIGSIGTLDTNYVNRGQNISLPDANGLYTAITGLDSAFNAGKSEHLITTYLSRLQAVTGGATGDNQVLPGITPTTVGVQVYRFFDQKDGTHFYTSSTTERDATEANRPDLAYEGVGLNATLAPSSDAASVPVYRFFDTGDGTHFFTINAVEVATIQQTRADMTYEGVVFYEHATAQTGDAAVYRFFDTQNGTHFYSASPTEQTQVLATRPDLVNEGVAFYTLSA